MYEVFVWSTTRQMVGHSFRTVQQSFSSVIYNSLTTSGQQ